MKPDESLMGTRTYQEAMQMEIDGLNEFKPAQQPPLRFLSHRRFFNTEKYTESIVSRRADAVVKLFDATPGASSITYALAIT
jgi:hypothetical protein